MIHYDTLGQEALLDIACMEETIWHLRNSRCLEICIPEYHQANKQVTNRNFLNHGYLINRNKGCYCSNQCILMSLKIENIGIFLVIFMREIN
jgi:hypothetical protein